MRPIADRSSVGERRFAYGDNLVDECPCPAVTADIGIGTDYWGDITITDSSVLRFADLYDEAVGELTSHNHDRGVIPEADARKAWLSVLDRARVSRPVKESTIEKGEEVARELGWLE